MAKKDFTKNNPALAFISGTEEANEIQETSKEESGAKKKTPAKKTAAPAPKKTTAPKKAPGTPPPGYKVNPQFIEKKSQRLNLLIQPSALNRLKKMAKKNKTSVNETINQLIIEKLESEGF
jgi:hypothetical protein